MKRYALGVDIGTTAVKAILIDVDGGIVAQASSPHDLYSPEQNWAEEDPAEWWSGLCAACRQTLGKSGVNPADIAGVGVSGMVPAMVFLDQGNRPLRRAIQQQDARTTEEIFFIQSNIDQDLLYRRTGSYTNQQHVLNRLLWVKKHEPDVWRQTQKVVGSYDYMNYRLTGQLSLEMNWAVESGLWNIHTMDWIDEYLAIADVSRSLFPVVHRAPEVIGEITIEAAYETGLSAGTPVIAGSADHVASALAAGLKQFGDLLVKFGGGGDVLFCTDKLETHPRLYIDFHDIPGYFLINGCMAASGSVLKWFVQNFVPDASDPQIFARLDQEASSLSAGSDGVIMLPYFLGEKTPLFDPLARGVIFGLGLHHGRAHVFRSILEAVAYGFRHHVDELEALNYHPVKVFGTNGGARSLLWRQITADVLGLPMLTFPHHPGSAMGVAFVAGMGVGLFQDWADIDRFLTGGILIEPNGKNHAVYDRAYRIYRDIYEHLKDDFRAVSGLYR